MLNYNERLNEAWNKVPTQYQKQLLEEIEHKAYIQDFTYTEEDKCNYDDNCNPIEVLVDAFINVIKVIAKHL